MKTMYSATPTGINMIPKNTIGAIIFRDTFSSIHRFHIHLVTKMSPATMCAQAAAAPAGGGDAGGAAEEKTETNASKGDEI